MTYSILFSASFLSAEHKVAFNTRLKKKHLMEGGGKISARLAQPQLSQFIVYVLFNNYSLKARGIVAKYLPSRESGEVNIPKATVHRD